MKKSNISITYLIEKESTLSLFRIPLNFFSEDNKSEPKITNKPDKENLKVSTNPENTSSTDKAIRVDISEDTINIHEDIIINKNVSSTANSTTSTPQQEGTSNSSSDDSDTSDSSADTSSLPSTSTSSQASLSEASTPKETTDSTPQQEKQPQTPTTQNHNTNPGSSLNMEEPTTAPSPSLDQHEQPKPTNNTTDDNTTTSNKQDIETNSKATSSQDKKVMDKESSAKQKKAEELKDKFGKKLPGNEKLQQAKDSAKQKIGDKLAKSPAASKALGAIGKAADAKETIDKTKDALENLDAEKMQEAAGDVAVQAAAKAATAIQPAVGKAIDIADKTIGKTEIGKKAKKGLGACCCTCGCIVPIVAIIAPLLFIMQAFSWVTNLFGRDQSIFGNQLSETDYALLAEASTEYSMQEYTDVTTKLYDRTFIQQLFGTNKYPIQTVLEDWIRNNYYYDEEMVEAHNSKYESLIEEGFVMSVKEGEPTSFGMAFDIIKENYSIKNLKAPSSSSQGEIDDVTYKTHEFGEHQALFEEVLTDLPTLVTRFEGQIDPNWFNENDTSKLSNLLNNIDEESQEWQDELNKISLITLLDYEINDVYIKEFNEFRNLSLRDVLKETSYTYYDANYYYSLVNTMFLPSDHEGNQKLNILRKKLVEKLASLELMTYMLAYQKYYSQVEAFVRNNPGYANISMYEDEAFWGQFFTFSNVEYFMALGSLTEPSFAYEIAAESTNPSLDSIDIYRTESGGKDYLGLKRFENWYATYSFGEPTIANGKYYLGSVTVEESAIKKYLFRKYNIESGIFDYATSLDDETKKQKNEKAFFAIFEEATGIPMAGTDNDGNVTLPAYQMTPDGVWQPSYALNGEATYVDIIDYDNVSQSKGFGDPYDPKTVAQYGLTHNNHTGIDYSIPSGTTIRAVNAGRAYFYKGNTGYGNYVKIVHDDGYVSYYAHGNGTFYFKSGARVSAGQQIMQSGNSGNSTGAHLHFEVRDPSGTPINPATYMYRNI